MKKFLSILLTLSMVSVLLIGCAGNTSKKDDSKKEDTKESTSQEEEKTAAKNPVDVNIAALSGPTGMGMVYFMSQADSGKITDNNYNFTIAASSDEITPSIVQGKLDIAAVPANLASVLYNNTDGEVCVLAINTLGVLYIVENGENINSVEDLRGKTIYASGKGATPEYALNYILTQNGIDPNTDVTIEYKSEHAECLSALMADENGIAMLPQPFVTTAMTKSDTIRVALDLTKEWEKLSENNKEDSALITGVVVARKAFIEENPEVVEAFLKHYKESVEYVNTNQDEAAELIGNYGIVVTEVAKKAIPDCNITFIDGKEMKEKLSGYLEVLLEQNSAAVGGKLPEDEFYFVD